MKISQQSSAIFGGRAGEEVILDQWNLTYENMKQFSHGLNSTICLRKIQLVEYFRGNKIVWVASDKNLIETILSKRKFISLYN